MKMTYDPEKFGYILHTYRKANNLTLADLGARIGKSKSTVWKYENGLLDVDLETLCEIAVALRVSANFLLESAMKPEDSPRKDGDANSSPSVLSYYMYFFDGYSKKIARNLITMADGGEQETESALFYHVESFDKPEDCRDFYTGKAFVSDLYTNLIFQNANNNVEKLFIVAKEPFKKRGIMKGILTGISYKMFQPISFKVILSERPLLEDETLEDRLKIDKENLVDLRKHSCLVLSEEYEDFKFKP
jgi:transcriptional regulator with XRE-family HTH domain